MVNNYFISVLLNLQYKWKLHLDDKKIAYNKSIKLNFKTVLYMYFIVGTLYSLLKREILFVLITLMSVPMRWNNVRRPHNFFLRLPQPLRGFIFEKQDHTYHGHNCFGLTYSVFINTRINEFVFKYIYIYI